tara:strand:- start:136 stop:378 length:243 start_codon:yes stop_codon:yes gene_type:complete
MLKKLIREKKLSYLHIRVYKDPFSDNYEIIFTSSKWPYWRKTQRTTDELLVKETFNLWTNHARVLQFLPARLCYRLMVGN